MPTSKGNIISYLVDTPLSEIESKQAAIEYKARSYQTKILPSIPGLSLRGSLRRLVTPGGGKKRRRKLGGRKPRVVSFNPNAPDADADGIVQEGTNQERAARKRRVVAPKKRGAVAQRIADAAARVERDLASGNTGKKKPARRVVTATPKKPKARKPDAGSPVIARVPKQKKPKKPNIIGRVAARLEENLRTPATPIRAKKAPKSFKPKALINGGADISQVLDILDNGPGGDKKIPRADYRVADMSDSQKDRMFLAIQRQMNLSRSVMSRYIPGNKGEDFTLEDLDNVLKDPNTDPAIVKALLPRRDDFALLGDVIETGGTDEAMQRFINLGTDNVAANVIQNSTLDLTKDRIEHQKAEVEVLRENLDADHAKHFVMFQAYKDKAFAIDEIDRYLARLDRIAEATRKLTGSENNAEALAAINQKRKETVAVRKAMVKYQKGRTLEVGKPVELIVGDRRSATSALLDVNLVGDGADQKLTTVNPGPGMEDLKAAVVHLRNGGDLRLVPDKFIADALKENSTTSRGAGGPERYYQQSFRSISAPTIYYAREKIADGTYGKPTTQGYIVKPLDSQRRDANTNEVAMNFFAREMGWSAGGVRRDGEITGRAGNKQHALVVDLVGSVVDTDDVKMYQDVNLAEIDPIERLESGMFNAIFGVSDRHYQNTLAFKGKDGKYHPAPIDFGRAFDYTFDDSRSGWLAYFEYETVRRGQDYSLTKDLKAADPQAVRALEAIDRQIDLAEAALEKWKRYQDNMQEVFGGRSGYDVDSVTYKSAKVARNNIDNIRKNKRAFVKLYWGI